MGRKRADGEGTYYHDAERGLWRYVVVVAGKNKAFSAKGKGGKAEAKAKYEAWKKERDGVTVAVSADMSVHDWAALWLESTKKGVISDDWYYEQELMIKAFPSWFAGKKISKVAPIEVKKVLKDFGENRSKSYCDKMQVFLKTIFREARENGICSENPAKELKKLDKIESPRRSFTLDQAQDILSFAATYRQNATHKAHKAIGQVIGAAIITLLCTGIRPGELLGLMWSDISDTMLTVNRAVYMKKGEDGKRRPHVTDYRAKTKSSLRTMPLPPMVATAISSLPHYGLYIFGCLNGNLMIPCNFNRSYQIFMRDLHIAHPEIPDLNPHECRHTFATLAIDNGANIKVLQLLLGHMNLDTTARYLHPDFEAMKDAQDAIWKKITCVNRCVNQEEKTGKDG